MFLLCDFNFSNTHEIYLKELVIKIILYYCFLPWSLGFWAISDMERAIQSTEVWNISSVLCNSFHTIAGKLIHMCPSQRLLIFYPEKQAWNIKKCLRNWLLPSIERKTIETEIFLEYFADFILVPYGINLLEMPELKFSWGNIFEFVSFWSTLQFSGNKRCWNTGKKE